MFRRCLAVAALLLGAALPPHAAASEIGVNATHIVIGQTGPLVGTSAMYGAHTAAGLQIAFAEANAAGGVQGRNLTLLSLDDGYVPANSIRNFQTLKNQSLLLAGVSGSASNTALIPYLVASGIPSVGPATGIGTLRSPFYEQIINVRAGYTDETVAHAITMVQQLRVHRIGCFYQNDVYGQSVLSSITAALNYVGLQLTVSGSYASGSTNISAGLEAIAGYPRKVQAVMMGAVEDPNALFIHSFLEDNRTDPNCIFLLLSVGATATFPAKVNKLYWPSLRFTQVLPPLDMSGLSIVSQFSNAFSLYASPGLSADLFMFESYVVGRLIVLILRGIPGEITRVAFLDEVYNSHLYSLGGLLAGLYNRNNSGCEQAVCGSNIGLRSIFPAMLDPSTGAMQYNASTGYYSYSITELSFPVTKIVRPLLFGQLVPTDDPVWQRVAEAIGEGLNTAIAALNAAGGIGGRPVELIQWQFSGDPATHAAAFTDRYDLLALVGSVVNCSQSLEAAATQIGTYQTDPVANLSAYNVTEVLVQASLPLEIMALVSFAFQLGLSVHLRAPATMAGQIALQVMVKSLNSLQQQPASSLTYASPAEALQGLSNAAVIVVGSDTDIQAMFLALADVPQLRLLTTSPRAAHLLDTLDVPTYSQATRFHYPYMFSTGSLSAISGPEVQDAVLYGQLLGNVLTTVLAKADNASLAYTTTAQVLNAWYGSQYKYNGVTLGPYYSTACSVDTTDCECNEGVRQVSVLTANRQQLPVSFTYALSTCRVVYADLLVPAEAGPWYIGVIVGVIGGLAILGPLGWWLSRRGRRDNATAPKNAKEPFCIIFTDIQSSTHMWATIPDVMTTALDVHHMIIRKLISKHKLYEVKTIGDSFMCATSSPQSAVDFALALQRELFEYDWGTAIDMEYMLQLEGHTGKWCASHPGWNGLRVRVGMHFGLGTVHLDPVSMGYDYYGTVVNTAARVEAVCHGGQIGITQAMHDALKGEFPGAQVTDLGEQILRGLAEPIHLYQLVPLELNGRKFPPLRLERSAVVEVEDHPPTEYGANVSHSHSKSTVFPITSKSSQVGGSTPPRSPTTSATRTVAMSTSLHWVESHPMVRSGQLSGEDLSVRYLTVLRALMTLLETQTNRVREAALRAFCERLHVKNCGAEGVELEETLNGLVQRVLPAALSAVCSAPRTTSAAVSRRASTVNPQDEEAQLSSPISTQDVEAQLVSPLSPMSPISKTQPLFAGHYPSSELPVEDV